MNLIEIVSNLDLERIVSRADCLGEEPNAALAAIDDLTGYEIPRELIARASMHDFSCQDDRDAYVACRAVRDYLASKLREAAEDAESGE